MKQNQKYIIYGAMAAALMVLSFGAGFFLSGNNVAKKPEPEELVAGIGTVAMDNGQILPYTPGSLTEAGTAEAAAPEEKEAVEAVKITPSTKMVYEYYYKGDGTIETTEEVPPYFLIDMTEEKMRDTFVDWDILVFQPDEVIMRKMVEGKSDQYYIVGVHEGYVAVFYASETNGSTLKEITDMPVSAFPSDEQARLRQGIPVTGRDALVRILQDYGS